MLIVIAIVFCSVIAISIGRKLYVEGYDFLAGMCYTAWLFFVIYMVTLI